MNFMCVDCDAKFIKNGNWNVLLRCIEVLEAMLIKSIDNSDEIYGDKTKTYFPLYRRNIAKAMERAGIHFQIVDFQTIKLILDDKYKECDRLYIFSNGINCIVSWI